jgi:hypothetical protein
VSKKPQNKRALSALRHGATAGILPHERTAWKRHLEAMRAELQPVGPVEEALVERIALALWRLRRVAAWEAGLLADARDHARVALGLSGASLVPDSPPRDRQNAAVSLLRRILEHWVRPLADSSEIVAEARAYVTSMRTLIAALERALAALDDPAGWTALDVGDDAQTIGSTLIDALDEQEKAVLAARWEIEPKEVHEVLTSSEDLPDLLALLGVERTRAALERALHSTRQNVALVEEALAAYDQATAERQARARPDLDELAKLQRYEAHLERTFYRALHEFESLQARRRGEAAPLGRIEVYGLDESPLPARCDGAE